MSFARKLVEQGKYADAVASASGEIESGAASAELYVDRATAYELLERYAEAVGDFEKALELDATEKLLERDLVDDAYFSALLATARQEPVGEGLKRLDGYRGVFPDGAHLADAEDWKRRLTGDLVSQLDKTVEMGPG
jgi:tetratricopeptide (TPR) repeat protein